MPERQVKRHIAEDEFDYGNHVINVTIALKHTNHYENIGDWILNDADGFHYWREVIIRAYPDKENACKLDYEVKEHSSVALDVETHSEHWLFGEAQVNRIPGIPEQVETTVKPVLEALDELYEYTTVDMEMEVEVAMERVEHERSWADVPDAVERISREIDEMVDEDSDASKSVE